MKKHHILLSFLLCLCIFGYGESTETLSLSIQWQGITVATVNMAHRTGFDTTGNQEITIYSKSNLLANIVSYVFDNNYDIVADSLYLPISYRKDITQKNFAEQSTTRYFRSENKGMFYDNVSDTTQEYPIESDTRDFFSSLYYLRSLDVTQSQEFTIDNAGKLSKIRSKYMGAEKIKTVIGNIDTYKVEISFEHIDLEPRRRSDILTNNLVNPNRKLYFWFSATGDDRLPVKAQYVTSKGSIWWVLKTISIACG